MACRGVDYPARAGHGPIVCVFKRGRRPLAHHRSAGPAHLVLFEQGGRSSSLPPTSPARNETSGLLQSSPSGRVKPRTITMLGGLLSPRDIISMSVRAG